MSAAVGRGGRKRKYDMTTAPFGGDLPKATKHRVTGTKYRNRDGQMVIAMARGKLTCPCGKPRYLCAKCGGCGLCPCGKPKQTCKKCGGRAFCPCGIQKQKCKKCGGSALCSCGKQRHRCKKCGGSSLCPCGKIRSLCAKCGGGSLCPCGKQKHTCMVCNTATALRVLSTNRLRNALGASKYKHLDLHASHVTAEDMLGCTVQHFKQHLETRFTTGMTWANHGNDGWHIDHVRPVSSFDLADTVQRQACFHFANTQPMWATENRKKRHRNYQEVKV